MTGFTRRTVLGHLLVSGGVLSGCNATGANRLSALPRDSASLTSPLAVGDLRWLGRVGFAVNGLAMQHLKKLGRPQFLEDQLAWPLPDAADLAAAIALLPVSQQSAEQRFKAFRIEQQRINTLVDPEDKQRARTQLNRAGNEAVLDTSRRYLLRALYSPAQLREQMTWFWMNHFNVYSGKAAVRWTLGDYEDRTVRPRVFGKFRDLVMATLKSPAMLEYLDNAQSAAGRVNENYARELMELHTLGVSGGPSGSSYQQQDVQELARILTGLGINRDGEPARVSPQRQGLYLREGLFEFNPNRHDFGEKTLLGQRIEGRGFVEVEQAVALLCRNPATAKFISTQLATYFVSDTPPSALVGRMTTAFERTDGDIAAVLRTLFLAPELDEALRSTNRKLKDPVQFVVSSLRLAYDGKTVGNLRPAINWLNQLGEPLYGRVTPDGYPLTESAWASSGQLVKRFEIARAIGSGQAGLFTGDDGKPMRTGFPMLTSRLYYDSIESTLGAATRLALTQTTSQQEWNTVLLSSLEWMQR